MGEIVPSMFSDDAVINGEFSCSSISQNIAEMFTRDAEGKLNRDRVTEANAVAISTALAFAKKPSLQDINEVTQAVQEYLVLCAKKSVKPTLSAVSLCLGLTRTSFLKMCATGCYKHPITGEDVPVPEDVQYLAIYLRDNITAIVESLLEENRVHPASGIFLLKNNSEYKDVVSYDYTITHNNVNTEKLAKKYNIDFDED